MKLNLVAFPLLVLAGAILGGACSVSSSPGGSGTHIDSTCLADAVACVHADECCSNVCAADGLCGTPVGGCFEDNAPCTGDAECCSNLCDADSFCGLAGSIACTDDGLSCGSDADCCSFFCNGGTCDPNANTSCAPDNSDCAADSDCCSSVCASDGLCGS